MKRIIFILSFILMGCQQWGQWQPYNNLYPSPSPTIQVSEAIPTTTPQDVCIISAVQSLNLREGAGLSYSVKDWLLAGEIVNKTGSQRGAWIEVITRDHVTGWINQNYCRGAK